MTKRDGMTKARGKAAEIVYGRTPRGQLLYDLLMTELTPAYLARKHHLPVSKIREMRAAAQKGFADGKRMARRSRAVLADAEKRNG